MNQDPKDPKKDPEDELKKLIEELESLTKKKRTSVSHAFLLHKSFAVHMIISFLLNLLMGVTTIGLSIGLQYPLVGIEIQGFLLAIVLLTLLENFVKILLFKYAFKLMIYSMGILSWLVQVILLYSISLIIGEGFVFNAVWDLFIFALIFTIMRFIASVYIRRWVYQKDILFIGGKK